MQERGRWLSFTVMGLAAFFMLSLLKDLGLLPFWARAVGSLLTIAMLYLGDWLDDRRELRSVQRFQHR